MIDRGSPGNQLPTVSGVLLVFSISPHTSLHGTILICSVLFTGNILAH